jgi:hypothetical protein
MRSHQKQSNEFNGAFSAEKVLDDSAASQQHPVAGPGFASAARLGTTAVNPRPGGTDQAGISISKDSPAGVTAREK